MNCRQAEHQIFADRDGAFDDPRRAALTEHLAQCMACRQMRDGFSAAIDVWRADARRAITPDSERAWHDLRRQMRNAGTAVAGGHRHLLAWIGAPLAAVAVVAIAFLVQPQWRGGSDGPPQAVARAEYVEVPSATASTVVFVDDKSGWLVVLASDAARPL